MNLIHSIELFKPHQIAEIISRTGTDLICYDRSNFLDADIDFGSIEVLICRDRDNVSSIIDVCNNLKMIFVVSTGVENLPFKKLEEKGIIVSNTGGINSEIMSQYALAYILSQSARVSENLLNQKNHYWKKFQCVDNLQNKNLLIVGAGKTGKALASKVVPLGMNCVGIKNHVEKLPNFSKVVSLESIDRYLEWADYVVCSIPLTPTTTYLFDKKRFEKMKSTATFINISRGKLVVIDDLVNALKRGGIKSAVLDVFESEPIGPENNLWDVPNLYLTPHSSGRLENFMDEAINYFIDNYNAYMKGGELPNIVNLRNGY